MFGQCSCLSVGRDDRGSSHIHAYRYHNNSLYIYLLYYIMCVYAYFIWTEIYIDLDGFRKMIDIDMPDISVCESLPFWMISISRFMTVHPPKWTQ
jgi:hypothetical protein